MSLSRVTVAYTSGLASGESPRRSRLSAGWARDGARPSRARPAQGPRQGALKLHALTAIANATISATAIMRNARKVNRHRPDRYQLGGTADR